MDKKDFDAKLKSLGISRQDFCDMTGLAYSSVANWKDESKPIPIWVDSWLENYKQQKGFNSFMNEIEKHTLKEIPMNDIKGFLIQKYLKSKLDNPQDCLKLSYQYHQVKVSVYFDYYKNTFNLYLVLSYDKFYYFTPLNIDNLMIKNPYLNDLPKEILQQVLDNGSLKNFYNNMREHMFDDIAKGNYDNDSTFSMGIKSNKNDNKNPFLSHLKKATMTETHLNFLNTQFNISKYILKKIQAKGYTIVTTSKASERKDLTLILDKYGVEL